MMLSNSEKLDKIIDLLELLLNYSKLTSRMEFRQMQEMDDLVQEVTELKDAGEAMGAQVDFTVGVLDKLGAKIDELLAAPEVDKAKLSELRSMVHETSTGFSEKREELKAGTVRNTKLDPSANA